MDSAVRAGSNAKQDFPYFTPGGFIDARQWDGLMPLSIEELRGKVEDYRKKGLNTQQIADELSLSQTTIDWLSSSGAAADERPSDIRVGWRSIAVKSGRIEAASYIFVDIIDEEIGDEVDAIVGISLNGIAFAQAIAGQMDLDLAISRSISEEEGGPVSYTHLTLPTSDLV